MSSHTQKGKKGLYEIARFIEHRSSYNGPGLSEEAPETALLNSDISSDGSRTCRRYSRLALGRGGRTFTVFKDDRQKIASPKNKWPHKV